MISEYDVPGESPGELAMSGHDDETHIVPPVPDAPTMVTIVAFELAQTKTWDGVR